MTPRAAALAVAALALAAPGRAGPQRIVNLTGQLNMSRSQGDVGDCHDFAAVALLEAAWSRSQGSCTRLSEADLFIHNTLLRWQCDDNGCRRPKETGSIVEDVAYAKFNGVLPGEVYDDFAKQYAAWRERNFPGKPDGRDETALEKDLEGRFLADPISTAERMSKRPRELARVATFLTDYQRDVLKLRRWKVRNTVMEFGMRSRSFGSACEDEGRERLRLISAELDAGRPVGIEMDISGMPAWHMQGKDGAHAFVALGYRDVRPIAAPRPVSANTGQSFAEPPPLQRVFTTRNSWGAGEDHEVGQKDLCRIFRIVSVLAPGETPAF